MYTYHLDHLKTFPRSKFEKQNPIVKENNLIFTNFYALTFIGVNKINLIFFFI